MCRRQINKSCNSRAAVGVLFLWCRLRPRRLSRSERRAYADCLERHARNATARSGQHPDSRCSSAQAQAALRLRDSSWFRWRMWACEVATLRASVGDTALSLCRGVRRVGHIDRGIRRHLRCHDTCGFFQQLRHLTPGGLPSPATGTIPQRCYGRPYFRSHYTSVTLGPWTVAPGIAAQSWKRRWGKGSAVCRADFHWVGFPTRLRTPQRAYEPPRALPVRARLQGQRKRPGA